MVILNRVLVQNSYGLVLRNRLRVGIQRLLALRFKNERQLQCDSFQLNWKLAELNIKKDCVYFVIAVSFIRSIGQTSH